MGSAAAPIHHHRTHAALPGVSCLLSPAERNGRRQSKPGSHLVDFRPAKLRSCISSDAYCINVTANPPCKHRRAPPRSALTPRLRLRIITLVCKLWLNAVNAWGRSGCVTTSNVSRRSVWPAFPDSNTLFTSRSRWHGIPGCVWAGGACFAEPASFEELAGLVSRCEKEGLPVRRCWAAVRTCSCAMKA